MDWIKKHIKQLKSNGIYISKQKEYTRDGKPFWEIVVERKKACGGYAKLKTGIYDPSLGNKIKNFENQHVKEKQNIIENQG